MTAHQPMITLAFAFRGKNDTPECSPRFHGGKGHTSFIVWPSQGISFFRFSHGFDVALEFRAALCKLYAYVIPNYAARLELSP